MTPLQRNSLRACARCGTVLSAGSTSAVWLTNCPAVRRARRCGIVSTLTSRSQLAAAEYSTPPRTSLKCP